LLEQKFFEVWVVGDPKEEKLIEKLREKLSEAHQKKHLRIRFRFYYGNSQSSPYFEALRPILLDNTRLSVVVEEKSLEALASDLEDLEDEVSLLVSRKLASSIKLPRSSRLKIVEV